MATKASASCIGSRLRVEPPCPEIKQATEYRRDRDKQCNEYL